MKLKNIEVYGIIYRIENLITKKSYIGKTTKGFNKRYSHKGIGIERVYKYHLHNKINNRNYNKHLFDSIEKYGFRNFRVYEVIDVAFSKYELNIKEVCWISIYNSKNNGYNNTIGGDGDKGGYRPKLGEAYRTTKVVCLNDLRVFDCIIEASLYYEVNKTSISANCSDNIKKHYVEQKNGTRLTFMYYNEYLTSPKDYIEMKLNYEYIPEKGGDVYNSKKIICLSTKEVFDSISDAERKYNIPNTNISRCCKKKRGYCGVVNNEKLKWMYYDDYINGEQYSDVPLNKKQVKCINTNEIFESTKEAGRNYNIYPSSISSCCNGKLKSAGKLLDGTKLQWEYI